MNIEIGSHAILRAEERGVTKQEIRDVLKTGTVITAKSTRLAKEKIFLFDKILNQKYFREKKVTVVYIIENTVVIVITVIAKYGTFTDSTN
jgi:hypothetical protein